MTFPFLTSLYFPSLRSLIVSAVLEGGGQGADQVERPGGVPLKHSLPQLQKLGTLPSPLLVGRACSPQLADMGMTLAKLQMGHAQGQVTLLSLGVPTGNLGIYAEPFNLPSFPPLLFCRSLCLHNMPGFSLRAGDKRVTHSPPGGPGRAPGIMAGLQATVGLPTARWHLETSHYNLQSQFWCSG